ncbi:pentatricopeptide repeat-containing protein At5g08510 isoform X2 [Momordica charantia]|uniref:Pentatricopeptide repeat-containing protein At5g08510 isoform X2 n=1 Tax=Momordica charantia TaxID=3673 RepID=A0A6J1D160_MOMCH|nr:pentatricopeptide repeat-containing protein At5g08510 isoform X2 [Momordica charantia]
MNQLKQIHAYGLRSGVDYTKFLIEKLLQIPNLPYACALFDLIPKPSVFLYNKFIQSYSSSGQHHRCWSLYYQMCRQGCSPNQHSFTFLFAACASLQNVFPGQMLHAHFCKSGFASDVFALTALLDMYAKLGMLRSARQLFDEMPVRDIPTWNSMVAGYSRSGDMGAALELFDRMPVRNVVSWTALISGYSQNGKYAKALEMFLRLENERGIKPNEVTVASVLPACAQLGALDIGRRIEAYARNNGFFKNLYVSNAILEVHARCGNIEEARQVFDEIGSKRNLCSWNTMIMGLAVHGRCSHAMELYDQMLTQRIRPDDVTFIGLLLACTHGGMVAKGRQLFESMESKFQIAPKLEHYGCLVDLLGRAGELEEAYNLIQTMPMVPDSVIWGALLGACSFHGSVELAEVAAESLFKLEPWNPGNYVILSNIYASAGDWRGVARLRKTMKGGHITKRAGYSYIEVGDGIHEFIVEDRSHLKSDEIYALLHGIYSIIKLQKPALHSQNEGMNPH